MPNNLISETSPYLLQHANNPVNWYAWNEEILKIARELNKPIIVSIGYSACHWCHVMEHESFEDTEVASIMNEHFINIKIDREERPDIDMVYMGAVQLMTGQGGWPLNCFALPDGRPIYGGTYFPKKNWIAILKNIAELYQNNYPKVLEYAESLTQGLHQLEIPTETEKQEFSWDTLRKSVNRWKSCFDNEWGGPKKAPKFPLPNNYQFLLRYNTIEQDANLKKHIDLTLKKMAFGGINDQLGGGFARYSTDIYWKVPHFEKMLYDNAQLVSLYTQAYQIHSNKLYKDTVYSTISFVENELTNSDGAFYSALDADSEGEEGKFYVWQKDDLRTLLNNHYELFCDYFSVNDLGYWEHDNYVLMRFEEDSAITLKHEISIETLHETISSCKRILLEERNKRIRPGLDNKILASWNAMHCKALAEAYLVFDEPKFKEQALKNATYLLKYHTTEFGKVYRTKSSGKMISGFLEDYAFMIDAFLFIYLISHDEKWLHTAKNIADYSIANFYDSEKTIFYYTDATEEKLIVRKAEWSDNVIPASSSQMAKNLHKLSIYFNSPEYKNIAVNLTKSVIHEIESYGPGYSNWADLLISFLTPEIEVAIVGKSVNEILPALYKQASSNVIFAVSEIESETELIKHRYIEGETKIYVCKNKQCLLPTDSISQAISQLQSLQS